MSELDVTVIQVRAEQAAEYERLFAERELARVQGAGAFIGARIFRAAFGTDRHEDIAKYVIAVEVPATPSTASTTPMPGSRSSTGSPTRSSRRIRWCTAEWCCTLSDRHGASASAPGAAMRTIRIPAGSSTPSRVPDDDPERLLVKRAGNAIPVRSSTRPGQPPGLITERDEE